VEKITGRTFTESVPLSSINTADEIEIVDAPREMCWEHAGDGADGAGASPSRQRQLSELREVRCCWRLTWWTGSSRSI